LAVRINAAVLQSSDRVRIGDSRPKEQLVSKDSPFFHFTVYLTAPPSTKKRKAAMTSLQPQSIELSKRTYGALDLAHRVFRSASCNQLHLGTPETKAVFARNDDVVTNFHHPASPFVPNHFGTFHAAASDAVLVDVPVAGPKSYLPNSTDALAHFQSLSDIWMDENSSGSMKPSSTLRAPTLQLPDQTKPSYTCNIEHQFLHQPVTEVAPFYAVIPTNPSKRPKSCWFYPVDELDEHDEWM
jgi:hypothetical protein